MQKITPFLWFDGQALQAAKFYVSLFRNSRIEDITRYGAGGPGRKGSVMSVSFRLAGQEFAALNGGPHYKFTPAISFFVSCKDQKEVDTLWRKLSRGAEKGQCGWLKDRFGVSWQIIPECLPELIADERGMRAMLQMSKIDIARLEAAVAGEP
jgi:predicted 3-demethylubiquinone-9 3-methyltransferase (glyoxalase superfamily)